MRRRSVRRSRRKSVRRSRRKSVRRSRRKSRKKSRKRLRKKSVRKSRRKSMKKHWATEHWVIFTKEGCSYCTKAKDFINERKKLNGATVHVVNGVGNPVLKRVMKEIGREDYKTWPKIFLREKFIGGYQDLVKYGTTHGTICTHCKAS